MEFDDSVLRELMQTFQAEAVDYVKTDLMPDFDFDAYNHDQDNEEDIIISAPVSEVVDGNVEDWKM